MSLENLVIVGGKENPDFKFGEAEKGDTRFSLNIWNSSKPNKPTIVPVPYRGGYFPGQGFNDVVLTGEYLFIADNEGILCYNANSPTRRYTELAGVHEVSALLCKTSKYLVSGAMNLIQIRSLDETFKHLAHSDFSNGQVEVPFDELEYDPEGDTFLSMVSFGSEGQEKIILNTAADESYLIDPESKEIQPLNVTDRPFPDTFQRKSKYHFVKNGDDSYLIFTEYGKEDQPHDIRTYSLSLATIPSSIREIRSFERGRIISMLPSPDEKLKLLWDNGMESYSETIYLETIDPMVATNKNVKIIEQKKLKKSYHLGDRLQEVNGQLLIVRHEEDEIVNAITEDYLKLSGTENDCAIPEISSIWEHPQFLYVTKAS